MPDIPALLGRVARSATLRPTWQRYGFAIMLPIVALICTALMMDLARAPFFALFSLSVVLSSIFGGMKPGFVTVAVGVILNLLMSEPRYSLRVASPDDITRLVVFAVAGVLVAAFVGAAGELQQKVDLHREKLSVTLNSIGDAVIATDTEGMITFMNPVAEHVTGWKLEEALGVELEKIFNIVNESTRATVANPVRKVLAEGRIVGLANHTILIRRDGSEIPIDDSAAPIRGSVGIIGVVLVFRDITEAKATQAAIVRSEKLASVGRLASTIAHEINNPLEAVGNLLYLVGEDRDLSLSSKKYIELAQAELSRAAELTKQTLSFHKGANVRTRISVREEIESVLKVYSSRAARFDVKLDNQVGPECYLHVEPGQFRQVISNFVTNAIDAMPNGGMLTISSKEGYSQNEPFVELCFTDTGTGIAKADLARIFDPFYTTKTDVGTGLGLWVTRTIVAEHDGSISVESDTTEGRSGTSFRITLPTAAADSDRTAGQGIA